MATRGKLAGEVILHADRGCQYTSAQLARFARNHNLVRSVGRTAVCWDNCSRIVLGHSLKSSSTTDNLWPTKSAAKLALGDWIALQQTPPPLRPRCDQPGGL